MMNALLCLLTAASVLRKVLWQQASGWTQDLMLLVKLRVHISVIMLILRRTHAAKRHLDMIKIIV